MSLQAPLIGKQSTYEILTRMSMFVSKYTKHSIVYNDIMSRALLGVAYTNSCFVLDTSGTVEAIMHRCQDPRNRSVACGDIDLFSQLSLLVCVYLYTSSCQLRSAYIEVKDVIFGNTHLVL